MLKKILLSLLVSVLVAIPYVWAQTNSKINDTRLVSQEKRFRTYNWNFNKFLINPKGEVMKRDLTGRESEEINDDLKKLF